MQGGKANEQLEAAFNIESEGDHVVTVRHPRQLYRVKQIVKQKVGSKMNIRKRYKVSLRWASYILKLKDRHVLSQSVSILIITGPV